MLKLLVNSAIPWDSTSFYRSWGVLHNLNRMMGRQLEMHNFQGRRLTWAELGAYDILFLQRPAKTQDLELITYCKKFGIKVWVDYDDNLFQVPNESRAFFDYAKPEVKKTMLTIIKMADVVTVSTLNLKDFIDKISNTDKTVVVPNALNDDWIKPATSFNADSKVILWRGSETHCGDLTYFTQFLYDAIDVSEDEWHFLGYNPFTLTNTPLFSKIKCYQGDDIMIYNDLLMSLKPRVMHVPLVDNPLNRAKSNIAWIEATYAGAVTIAPNWPEWQRPGVICYDTEEDYKKLLMETSLDYAKCWQESMEYIKNNLMLSYVNTKRAEIINRLRPHWIDDALPMIQVIQDEDHS